MLDNVMANKGIYNILVFPEVAHTLKEFLISKVIFDISIGNIRTLYNPQNWQNGQILKFEGCFVEFDRTQTEKDGFKRIWVKFSDGSANALPIEFAPYFQICLHNSEPIEPPPPVTITTLSFIMSLTFCKSKEILVLPNKSSILISLI